MFSTRVIWCFAMAGGPMVALHPNIIGSTDVAFNGAMTILIGYAQADHVPRPPPATVFHMPLQLAGRGAAAWLSLFGAGLTVPIARRT